MLRSSLSALGGESSKLLAEVGALSRLALEVMSRLLLNPFRGERVRVRPALVQTVRAGNESLPLVGLICLLVGMIMALQSAYQFAPARRGVDLVAELCRGSR